ARVERDTDDRRGDLERAAKVPTRIDPLVPRDEIVDTAFAAALAATDTAVAAPQPRLGVDLDGRRRARSAYRTQARAQLGAAASVADAVVIEDTGGIDQLAEVIGGDHGQLLGSRITSVGGPSVSSGITDSGRH